MRPRPHTHTNARMHIRTRLHRAQSTAGRWMPGLCSHSKWPARVPTPPPRAGKHSHGKGVTFTGAPGNLEHTAAAHQTPGKTSFLERRRPQDPRRAWSHPRGDAGEGHRLKCISRWVNKRKPCSLKWKQDGSESELQKSHDPWGCPQPGAGLWLHMCLHHWRGE